jgi:hypothetical protein
VWACPVCSAGIRQGRASEIEAAVNAQWDRGGGVLFLTLTLRHSAADSLQDLITSVRHCWSKVTTGRAWMADQKDSGIVGYVRTVEVTFGDLDSGGAGWHPHVHALVFVDRDLDDSSVKRLEDSIFSRWERAALRTGAGQPTREHGVRLQHVRRGGPSLGEYLSKVTDEFGVERPVGMEMTRGDLKSNVSGWGRGLHPFQLLDVVELGGEEDAQRANALWHEYESATKGLRCLTWSRGLLDDLFPDGLPEEHEDENRELVVEIPFPVWRDAGRRGVDVEILEAVEWGGSATTVRALLIRSLGAKNVDCFWPE